MNLNKIPASQKSTPPFNLAREQTYKILGLFEFIAKFVHLQLKCTYLAFQNFDDFECKVCASKLHLAVHSENNDILSFCSSSQKGLLF